MYLPCHIKYFNKARNTRDETRKAGERSRDDSRYRNESGKRIIRSVLTYFNVSLSNGQCSVKEFGRGTLSDRFLYNGHRQNHGQNCSRNAQANGK